LAVDKRMGGEAEGLPVLFQKQILESRLHLIALFTLNLGKADRGWIHLFDQGNELQ